MSDRTSILETFGGGRRVVFMTIALAIGAGIYHWQNFGAGDAMREVGAELGLDVHEEGQRRQLRGRIDGIGIAVDTTIERLGGESRWYTDFKLYAPDQPSGRIVGASLRQKAIGTVQGSEWLSTGDAAFDKAVFVEGDPAEMSAHLDAESRAAIVAATDAGWELEDMAWNARESGRITSARKIRRLLDLGLAAASLTRLKDDPAGSMRIGVETASSSGLPAAAGEQGDRVASLGGVAGASKPVTPENAIEALAEVNTQRSLEAAMLLARAGDNRQEVRNRLVAAVLADERRGEVIPILAEVGGHLEIAVLGSVTGEHEKAAKATVAAIEARL